MKTEKKPTILIALDYDPTAQKIAEAGYKLANTMNAEIVLLHVVSEPVVYSAPGHVTIMGFAGYQDIPEIQMENSDALHKATQMFLDKVKLHLGDKEITTIVKEGDCAESILKTAKEQHAELIVMGTHSRKWLENILMGSVAEKVLRSTTIPLYIIPTKQKK